MTYAVSFTVRGGTRFPVDMLRYDSCYPASGDDAAHLEACLDRDVRAAERGATPIKLVHVSGQRGWKPTSGRWSSFLWGVDPMSITEDKRS